MNPEIYARALWHTIEGGMTPKKAVSALAQTLERQGRLKLLPKIARSFERYASRERARDMLTLSTARADDARAKREAKELLKVMHIEAKDVELATDESLVGGWRLEGREYLYDASFKKHLLSIYNRATQ